MELAYHSFKQAEHSDTRNSLSPLKTVAVQSVFMSQGASLEFKQ